jgi:hypothetical protein
MIFASILKSRGIHDLVDVIGGFGAIKDTPGLETGAYVCPSTLKRGTAAAEGRGFLGWIKRLIS